MSLVITKVSWKFKLCIFGKAFRPELIRTALSNNFSRGDFAASASLVKGAFIGLFALTTANSQDTQIPSI